MEEILHHLVPFHCSFAFSHSPPPLESQCCSLVWVVRDFFHSGSGVVCGRKQEVNVKIEGVVGEIVLALVQDFFHQQYFCSQPLVDQKALVQDKRWKCIKSSSRPEKRSLSNQSEWMRDAKASTGSSISCSPHPKVEEPPVHQMASAIRW